MKKFLLAMAAFGSLSISFDASAATRMTLHEEFTGENCPPCASTNPGFWDLCNGSGNPSKLIHISYMVPIPSEGWYCNRTTPIYTARDSYYSVPFAPYGRFDGHVPDASASSPGHPYYFTQADIDAEAAIASPFTITVTSAWDGTYANIITTVTITCDASGAWTGSGTTPNVKLRAALIKTDDFATSPGTNGETHFENVVQAMYPDVNGTTLPTSWMAGESHTYTITGAVPTWLDKSQNPYMVVWIQDENDKSIAQAAKGAPLTLAVDASATAAPGKACAASASSSVTPVVTIKNTGTNPLNSATVYYKFDGGTMASVPWSGTLTAGATATVAIPATSLTAGSHTFYDSVANPNSMADVNVVNNANTVNEMIINTTSNALPQSNDFESALPANWSFYDENGNGKNFTVATVTPHTGGSGAKAAKHDNFNYSSGEENLIIIPTPTTSANSKLVFWVAYAQYSSENDKLEVVYSTDCGSGWTSLFNKSGSALATRTDTTAAFTPKANQWRREVVDISSVPTGATLAFKATSNFGNNLYIDDVNMLDATAVENVNVANMDISIHPNPTSGEAVLAFSLVKESTVSVQLVDITGRVVSNIAAGKMGKGAQTININTSAISAGIYNVVIRTEEGITTERLSVTK